MINTESFVLYESVYKQFEILKKRKPEVATDFIEAIMEFGLYGVIPDEESDIWLYGFEQAITSIERAKTRYTASIENGKKGGRPSKNLDQDEVLAKKAELKTWKAVASFYGISEDTLRKIRASWGTVEPEKPKNLNDNVNENVNENENDNENENENVKVSAKGQKKLAELDKYINDQIERIMEEKGYKLVKDFDVSVDRIQLDKEYSKRRKQILERYKII